jgi:hypothetical protein
VNKEKLKEILVKHKKWLIHKDGGVCADLSGADLSGANLYKVNLSEADLSRANLRGADLREADLHGADLSGANLGRANLYEAILYRANLCGADMSEVNLSGADLSRANLSRADLCGANLNEADLRMADLCEVRMNGCTVFYALQCPEKGAYTAFKKAGGYIVELEIPKDALRSSATTRKCRASKAKVISITSADGENSVESIASDYDGKFIYRIEETVEVPDFDTDRWNECAAGIHHFITRAEAEQYEEGGCC